MSELYTVGAIAKLLNEPIFRVMYLIRSRGLEPVMRAGHVRLFSSEQVKVIENFSNQLKAAKGVNHV